MTALQAVQGLQLLLSAVAVALAVRQARGAWRDRRAKGEATPAQAEVLEERWLTAEAIVLFTLFAGWSTVMQITARPFGETWTWAANGTALRVLLVYWIWRRMASRRRVRSLAGELS